VRQRLLNRGTLRRYYCYLRSRIRILPRWLMDCLKKMNEPTVEEEQVRTSRKKSIATVENRQGIQRSRSARRYRGWSVALLALAWLIGPSVSAVFAQWPTEPLQPIQPIDPFHRNQPPSPEELKKFENVVRLEILADVDAVRPGQSIELAVVFDIRRDWRIFWQAPTDRIGSIGRSAPTKVEIQAPAGFVVDEVQYPAPIPVSQADGSRQFVYENSAAILVSITPPADLEPGATVDFKVETSWSIQKKDRKDVLAYSRSVETSLPVVESGVSPRNDNVDQFKTFRTRIPKPISEAPDIEAYWDNLAVNPVFVLRFVDVDHVDFFPMSDRFSNAAYLSQKLVRGPGEDEVQLKIRYGVASSGTYSSLAAKGVVLQQRGDQIDYYYLLVPRSVGRRFKNR